MAEREPRISLHDSSKRPKYDCDLVDRISALPDSILSLILSILPTKNAVATSILSKRWKFAWVTVHNLDFCCDSYAKEQNENAIMKFVGFVNRVLLLNDAGLLNKLTLDCDFGRISSHVSSWINTATTRNVYELSLFLNADDGQFEMPISVFNCSSLRSLDLRGNIYVSAAIPVFLPRLETLKLDGVHFQSEEAFEKLISGCPILNFLYLQMYDDDGFTCIISSTSLRYLVIFFGDRCGLKLNACSLEYLIIMGEISEIFVQKNLKSLVEVELDINYDEHSNNSIVEALGAFDCAKTIALSGDVLRALMHATVSLSTEFKRLVELKIETSSWGCSSLQDFIQYTVNLEVLTIDQSESYDESEEKWNSPVEVARCLSNSLKTVVVDDYHGYEDERETIRYILKHGSALEVIEISFDGSMNDSEMLKLEKEICEFPRKSPVCEVIFF